MKTFLFLRGVDTPAKRQFSERLMKALNPDNNTVRAVRLSLLDQVDDPTDKAQLKAADKGCKNLVKRLLMGSHSERFIVIDNESIFPVHWQSYYTMAHELAPETLAWGIDFFVDENLLTDPQKQKTNEQKRNCDIFNATMYKYWCIKNEEEASEFLKNFSHDLA